LRAVWQAELGRDSGQAIACGPTHDGRKGVDPRVAPQLPQAGVRAAGEVLLRGADVGAHQRIC
jgi:hypothetical protein